MLIIYLLIKILLRNFFFLLKTLGVKDLWHGRADLVIKARTGEQIVKVTMDKEKDAEEEEPASKKTELEHSEDCTNSYLDCLAEVNARVFCGSLSTFLKEKPYRQAISQTLVNSYLAVNNRKWRENMLTSSFLVCQNSVFINFYNMKNDVLLAQTKPMKLFKGKNDVNYATYFSVWMALNFEIFSCGMDEKFYATAKKSCFKDFLDSTGVIEKYRDDIECQFSSAISKKTKPKAEVTDGDHCISHEIKNELIEKFKKRRTPPSNAS